MTHTPPTLGLRLALMTTFLMLGIPPIIRVYVAYRINAGESDDAVLLGIPFDFWTIAAAVAGIAVLGGAVLAWRGRPPLMQWLYQIFVVIALGIIVIEAYVRYEASREPSSLSNMGSSFDSFNAIFRCLLPIQTAVTLYTLWYINREPSRRFFAQYKE